MRPSTCSRRVPPATPIELTQFELGERRERNRRGRRRRRDSRSPSRTRSLPTHRADPGSRGGRGARRPQSRRLSSSPQLDAADRQIVGLLLASGSAGEAPPRELAQLLLLAGRLLSF